MKPDEKDKRESECGVDLRKLAEVSNTAPAKGGSIDEISLQSHRRAVAYGRARGNV